MIGRIPLAPAVMSGVYRFTYTYDFETLGTTVAVSFQCPYADGRTNAARMRHYGMRYALAVARGESDPFAASRALRAKVQTDEGETLDYQAGIPA